MFFKLIQRLTGRAILTHAQPMGYPYPPMWVTPIHAIAYSEKQTTNFYGLKKQILVSKKNITNFSIRVSVDFYRNR